VRPKLGGLRSGSSKKSNRLVFITRAGGDVNPMGESPGPQIVGRVLRRRAAPYHLQPVYTLGTYMDALFVQKSHLHKKYL
jgi:hypothetical protein